MSGKRNTQLKRRCKRVWKGSVELRMLYGVQGFDRFFAHAKKDMKRGNMAVLEDLEMQLKDKSTEE